MLACCYITAESHECALVSVFPMLLCPAQLFSGSSEYVQQAERTSCLSYDQYSNEVCRSTLPNDYAIRHKLDC